jgi:hypothetical protein
LADKLSEEYKGNTNENATAFWRDSLRSFRPVVQSVLSSRSKRQKKRDFVKILMKRTRVETERDENKRVDGRVALLVLLFFGPSFLPFFQSYLNFVAPVLRCSRFFFHFFFFFFSPLLLLFSRVCVVRQSFTSPELLSCSFFLSFRASVFEERERRERGNKTEYCVSYYQNGKSEREREILLLCVSRKRRRQTRE